jgi:hypothetical protein
MYFLFISHLHEFTPPIPAFPLKGGSGLGGAAARLFQMIEVLSVSFPRAEKPLRRNRSKSKTYKSFFKNFPVWECS